MTDATDTPVGMHECATCTRCATTYAIVHPVCPKCAERERVAVEISRLERELQTARLSRLTTEAVAKTARRNAEAELSHLKDRLREMRQDLDYREGSVAKFDMGLRALLAEDEGDGREPDGYRVEGGRVIPTDRCERT